MSSAVDVEAYTLMPLSEATRSSQCPQEYIHILANSWRAADIPVDLVAAEILVQALKSLPVVESSIAGCTNSRWWRGIDGYHWYTGYGNFATVEGYNAEKRNTNSAPTWTPRDVVLGKRSASYRKNGD